MINKKEEIYNKLLQVCKNTSDTYPQDWVNYPSVQFLEEENTPQEVVDKKEMQSYLRYKIDIWSKESTSNLAIAINDVFFNMGMFRTTSVDFAEPNGLKHKVMKFEGILDIQSDIVHQR